MGIIGFRVNIGLGLDDMRKVCSGFGRFSSAPNYWGALTAVLLMRALTAILPPRNTGQQLPTLYSNLSACFSSRAPMVRMTPGKCRARKQMHPFSDCFADWGATVRSVLFDSGMCEVLKRNEPRASILA